MGLCFVLIAVMLCMSLLNETAPEVDNVGTQINEDIKNIYESPNE